MINLDHILSGLQDPLDSVCAKPILTLKGPPNCPNKGPTTKGADLNNSKLAINEETKHISTLENNVLGLKVKSGYLKQTIWPSTGFHNLPCATLVKIFSYFSEREISSCLAPVCRSWRFASQDASLWKQLQFRGSQVPSATICVMLRRAKQLEAISLINVPDITTILRQLCRSNCKVKRVVVKNCSNPSTDERIPETIFGHLIRSCQEIESLDLDNTQFFPNNFVQDLVRLPYLRSINLSKNIYLRARDLVTLSHNCWKLEELRVAHLKLRDDKNSLTDTDALLIFDNLKSSLKTLKFDLNGLGAASYEAILKCSKIESLCLKNAFYLTGDILQRFPVCMPHIKTLKMERTDLLLNADFVNLFTLHENIMKNLTCLKLAGCWKLDDSGIKTIVDTCAETIECLSFRSCKLLTAEGIQYAVKHCHKLRYLDIAHLMRLDEPTMVLFLELAPLLKVLVIDDDTSNEGTLSHILTKKPQLEIKQSFSEYYKNQSRFKLK